MAVEFKPALLGEVRRNQAKIGQIPGEMKTHHRHQRQTAQLIRPGQTLWLVACRRSHRGCR